MKAGGRGLYEMSISPLWPRGTIDEALAHGGEGDLLTGGSVKAKLGRWLLLLLCSAGSLTLIGGSAQAASPAIALPAQYVTAGTAVLRGTISTGGVQTRWQFEYGRTKNYGSFTNTRGIPAGRDTVAVSVKLTGLAPHTRYHFRVLMQQGPGTISYPIFVNFGADRSFVTQVTGNLGLGPTTLVFRTRDVPVSLYCVGSAICKAALQITYVRPGPRHKVLTLAKRMIALRGRRYGTFLAKLNNAALDLLKHNRNQIVATLTLIPTTGNARLTSRITLIRG